MREELIAFESNSVSCEGLVLVGKRIERVERLEHLNNCFRKSLGSFSEKEMKKF